MLLSTRIPEDPQIVADKGLNEPIAALRLKLEADLNGDGSYSGTTIAISDSDGR